MFDVDFLTLNIKRVHFHELRKITKLLANKVGRAFF